MKINPLNSYDAINRIKKNSEKAQVSQTDFQVSDEVNISDQAKEVERLIKGAKNSNIDRAELTANLKKQIQSGNYNVDAQLLSQKILDSIIKE